MQVVHFHGSVKTHCGPQCGRTSEPATGAHGSPWRSIAMSISRRLSHLRKQDGNNTNRCQRHFLWILAHIALRAAFWHHGPVTVGTTVGTTHPTTNQRNFYALEPRHVVCCTVVGDAPESVVWRLAGGVRRMLCQGRARRERGEGGRTGEEYRCLLCSLCVCCC